MGMCVCMPSFITVWFFFLPTVPVSVMERGESVASRFGEETQRKLDVLSGKRDMRAAVDI